MQLQKNTDTTSDIFTRNLIEDTFHKYLDEFQINLVVDIKDNDNLSPKNKILLAATRDFICFKLDLDLFISILGMLWIIDVDTFNPYNQTEVEKLCFAILDLSWCIRNNPKKHISSISRILDYYHQNSHII